MKFVVVVGSLKPSLEVGGRLAGGDGETGAGREVGAGVAWADPGSGLTVAAGGRALMFRYNYGEWGLSGLIYSPDPGRKSAGERAPLYMVWTLTMLHDKNYKSLFTCALTGWPPRTSPTRVCASGPATLDPGAEFARLEVGLVASRTSSYREALPSGCPALHGAHPVDSKSADRAVCRFAAGAVWLHARGK